MEYRALSILLLTLAGATVIFADCGLSKTCGNIGLSGTTVRASCRTASGSSQSASIDTNRCVGNSNGKLVCGAAYANSCSNIGFSNVLGNNPFVTASCLNTGGQRVGTGINLSQCIANQNGVLACCSS